MTLYQLREWSLKSDRQKPSCMMDLLPWQQGVPSQYQYEQEYSRIFGWNS